MEGGDRLCNMLKDSADQGDAHDYTLLDQGRLMFSVFWQCTMTLDAVQLVQLVSQLEGIRSRLVRADLSAPA